MVGSKVWKIRSVDVARSIVLTAAVVGLARFLSCAAIRSDVLRASSTESLRLIVFDRVPWPRPDILHRARKPVFGGAAYDDRIARLRLRQAYGRLVRRADDRGIFVILDRALPSRLLPAFPAGVPIARVPLVDAVAATAAFLQDPA